MCADEGHARLPVTSRSRSFYEHMFVTVAAGNLAKERLESLSAEPGNVTR
jgi:hypothetical protein